MSRFDDSNRLLEGRLDPDDAPPGLREVAALVHAARAAASPAELAGEQLLVDQMAAAVREAAVGSAIRYKHRADWAKVASAKVVVLAGVLVLGGGAAAAATGSLPSGIQRAISHGLSHVGISVPDPAPHPAPRPSAHPGPQKESTPPTTAVSPTATTATSTVPPAAQKTGLCAAYAHGTPSKHSAALVRLAAAAAAEHETVSQFCAGTGTTTTTAATRPGVGHGNHPAHQPVPHQAHQPHQAKGVHGATPGGHGKGKSTKSQQATTSLQPLTTNGKSTKHTGEPSTRPHSSPAKVTPRSTAPKAHGADHGGAQQAHRPAPASHNPLPNGNAHAKGGHA